MGRVATVILVLCFGFSFDLSQVQASRGKRSSSSNGQFSFQIESQGRALPSYNHRGRTYVEGHFGNTYQIRVFNNTAERAEAVVTVDGRDVITGNPGNYRKQRGYVIAPFSSVLIDGFRQSWSQVASFRFTGVGDSYAARMGDASNVGVVGVAVFKQKSHRPPPPYRYAPQREQNLGTGYGKKSSGASQPAPSADDLSGYGESEARDRSSRSKQGIGTGYGGSAYSPASQTTFERRRRRPDEVLAVRYDDRQGLIAKGVLPRPYSPPPQYYREPVATPDPFPGFAPPPPSYWWE